VPKRSTPSIANHEPTSVPSRAHPKGGTTIPELAISEPDELEEEIAPAECTFQEGDHVVYPHHGAGVVLIRESRELLGETRDYLTIKILHNDMTVMVPCENAHLAGLRRVIDPKQVEEVIAVLTGELSDMPKNWNRRFKYNREKIKTGDIFEIAEVVRNLAIREMDKGLSTGEKQMYTRAKKILASELMYALEMEEGEAEEHLEELIKDAHEERSGASA
jgi:CarD family transcriptional regulator